jgi:hypothetical protein
MPAQISPITEGDLPRVADFLHEHFPHEPRESSQRWRRALRSPWPGEPPNWGFMAREGESIVGVYVAHYSEQQIAGSPERFCNLGVWHVLPEHRMNSIRMAKAILDQPGYHFTDLTPAENVVALNRRLGFSELDTRGFVAPCLPWPSLPGRARVHSDPARLEEVLEGRDREIFMDHRGAAGLRHVAIVEGATSCYVALRPERLRGLRAVSLLYVGEPALLRSQARRFARHLLLHQRVLAYTAEERIAGFRPRLSRTLRSPQTRMFRSDTLSAKDIGYLYSELVCGPDD